MAFPPRRQRTARGDFEPNPPDATVPDDVPAADINYDFANIWGRASDISFVGKEKSTLDQLVFELLSGQYFREAA